MGDRSVPDSGVLLVFPSGWRRSIFRSVNNTRCQLWDWVHNVDTCGRIPLTTFPFESKHKDPGLEYSSPHSRIMRSALASLPIQHQDYTFIDLGCGKGRALLVASELPFRRIIGVEFAPSLADTARRNVGTWRLSARRCGDLAVITGDAAEYHLPPEPLVLFLANPFFPAVMTEVIENIEASLRGVPRDLVVVYVGLMHRRDSSFGARPEYERLLRQRYFDVYRHRPLTAAEWKMSKSTA